MVKKKGISCINGAVICSRLAIGDKLFISLHVHPVNKLLHPQECNKIEHDYSCIFLHKVI